MFRKVAILSCEPQQMGLDKKPSAKIMGRPSDFGLDLGRRLARMPVNLRNLDLHLSLDLSLDLERLKTDISVQNPEALVACKHGMLKIIDSTILSKNHRFHYP